MATLTSQQLEEAKLLAKKVSQPSFSPSSDPATFQKYQDYRNQISQLAESNPLTAGQGIRLADIYLGIDPGHTFDTKSFGGPEGIQSKYGGLQGLAKSLIEGSAPVAGRTDVPGGYSITEPGGGFVPSTPVTDSRPASQLTREEYAARAGVDVSRVQGSPGSYVVGDQQQNNLAIIAGINQEGNADQNTALNAILGEFGKVDTSKSLELTDKLSSFMEGVFNAPELEKPQSLSQLFASKKSELGVDKLEADLAGIDAKLKQMDADFASQIETEEGKLISTREISRNIGQTEIAYNRKRRDLIVEKDAIANQLNNKLNTLEMVMSFTQSDFTNASNYYNQQFNRNVGILNLVLNLDERSQSRQDKIKNESQANLNTVYNLMDKQNIKWDSLSASQKLSIEKLELSAGLPKGISSLIAKSSPNLEIKATTSRTDASGKVYYDVLLTDPKTGAMSVKSIYRGTEEPTKPTEGDKAKALSQQMFQALNTRKGTDGYVSPATWNSLRKGWIAEGGSGKTFDENYSQFINPTHEGDYFVAG